VRTDFTNHAEYLPNNSVINVFSGRSPSWHYLYFSSGFTYKLALHNLSVGFDYGLGIPVSKQQVFNITEPTQETFLRGDLDDNMKTSVHKLSFILSYTYFFKARERKYGPLSIIDEIKKMKKKSRLSLKKKKP
jgi:hypothetical protein